MKKISIILLSILCPSSLFAQKTLSLQQCREMALQYNKEMAASVKQTESALYTMKSYKGNFFPNFTANGMGLYSTADGGFELKVAKCPLFCMMQPGTWSRQAFIPISPVSISIIKSGQSTWAESGSSSRFIWAVRSGCLPDVCLGERDGRDERGADGDGSDPQNRQSLCPGREGTGDEKRWRINITLCSGNCCRMSRERLQTWPETAERCLESAGEAERKRTLHP